MAGASSCASHRMKRSSARLHDSLHAIRCAQGVQDVTYFCSTRQPRQHLAIRIEGYPRLRLPDRLGISLRNGPVRV
eukprot:scaffold1664_cov351-Prasinococcus_capsulatus_cf.AAC.6